MHHRQTGHFFQRAAKGVRRRPGRIEGTDPQNRMLGQSELLFPTVVVRGADGALHTYEGGDVGAWYDAAARA